MKIMNIYFDCEFTSLEKDAQLISIGLKTDTDETFYAELDDYKEHPSFHMNLNFLSNNVLNNLYFIEKNNKMVVNKELSEAFDRSKITNIFYGDKQYISTVLNNWLEKLKEESNDKDFKIQFISDVCYYNFVLLIDLITNEGTAFNMPSYISPYCHDISDDIADDLYLNYFEAFDVNREEYMKTICNDEYKELVNKFGRELKHNSLWDAMVIKELHKAIYG